MAMKGARWEVSGIVQGVGFRPWVCGKAAELGVFGSVRNTVGGVVVEAVGSADELKTLGAILKNNAPLPARVEAVTKRELSGEECGAIAARGSFFSILESERSESGGLPQVSPDLAMCDDCRAEIRDATGRRFHYPFTTCARCGPRYTIMESLPFDRERTTMRHFPLCRECLQEYENPADRRFHAQAMACPQCGPQLRWLNEKGILLDRREAALTKAAAALREGAIIAVLGVGGFHLMVLAEDANAVRKLRERKGRAWKPFAMMGRTLGEFAGCVTSGHTEEGLLRSPAAPIVLLERTDDGKRFAGIADEAPCFGVMLAATPLHELLLEAVGAPVVATSGNAGDTPICIGEPEAVSRLGEIADFFLSHDRPVARRCDDSVVRVIGGRTALARRAKGYVPAVLPWKIAGMPKNFPAVLGCGGHQKNAPAVWKDGNLLNGCHIGDLGNPLGREEWRRQVQWFREAIGGEFIVATDLHPDYGSSLEAEKLPGDKVAIQHHEAHAFAALVESGEESACAVVWDGTGLGTDFRVWGGEFFEVDASGECLRRGSLKPFFLPGGERAILEPFRSAVGAVFSGCKEILDEKIFAKLGLEPGKAEALLALLRQKIGVETTSAGRLFDAASALLGLVAGKVSDAQAATVLEGAATGNCGKEKEMEEVFLPIEMREGMLELDWTPALRLCAQGGDVKKIARAWHGSLADGICRMAEQIGRDAVLLSGGCFQNKLLAECVFRKLQNKGYRVHLPESLPANDGGLAAGQCAAAILSARKKFLESEREGEKCTRA